MCKTRGIEDDGSSTITMSFHGEFEKDMNKKHFWSHLDDERSKYFLV